MIYPKKPENEEKRLKTLRNLNILDTEAEERFNRITRIACKLFDVPIATVTLIDADRQWFKAYEGLDNREGPRENSFCAHAILSDDVMIVENATEDKRFHDNPLVTGNPNIRFYLGRPLKIKECNVGTLCLIDNKPRDFQNEDLKVIDDLSEMVELELESLHLSTTDELTHLSNRRGFLKIANFIFEKCQHYNEKFTLLYFDLDKFKHINDVYGHDEGDKVLKLFSNLLLSHFGESDVVARLGGDEFCVVCARKDQEEVSNAITRLIDTLNSFNKQPYPIQCSVGSICYQKDKHASLEELIALADSKMFKDKFSKA